MIERALQAIVDFQRDRPVMAENNTPETLIALIQGEAEELSESPPDYLSDTDYLKQEIADLIIYATTLAHVLEPDSDISGLIGSIVLEKVALNHARYKAGDFQTGDYQTQVSCAREKAKQLKIKEVFYE